MIKESDDAHMEPFKRKMEDFFAGANSDLNRETSQSQECKQEFDKVMKYFDFKVKGTKEVTPQDFFSVWAPFCNDFVTIWRKEQHKIVKKRYVLIFLRV